MFMNTMYPQTATSEATTKLKIMASSWRPKQVNILLSGACKDDDDR